MCGRNVQIIGLVLEEGAAVLDPGLHLGVATQTDGLQQWPGHHLGVATQIWSALSGTWCGRHLETQPGGVTSLDPDVDVTLEKKLNQVE